VMVSLCLVCGAAFGVALDRVVLKRGDGLLTAPSDGGDRPGQTRARTGKVTPKSPTVVADEISSNSDRAPSALPPLAGPPTLNEAPRPATNPSNHVRKLAFRAAPSDTAPKPSTSSWRDVATVAPPSVGVDWPAPAAPVTTLPTSNTPSPILPSMATEASPVVSPPTRPAVDSLSEERLLAAALRALRAQTDPQSALTALDEYRSHYPHGRLFVEAEVLRVDALAALKNTPEVLRVLDGLDFAQMPGGLARQLHRAELRAGVGRHREAEADFTSVLIRARGQDLEVIEPALWGRAKSRASHGDAIGARLDADEYLRRFPNGRFAAAVAQIGSSVAP